MKKVSLTEQAEKALNVVCDAALKYDGLGALAAVQSIQQEIREDIEQASK
jgi:hypothetical protein